MEDKRQHIASKPDYFNLLNLPVSFQVDVKNLERHYHLLQQQIHPDRFAQASESERRVAVQYSSLINDAYDTLKQPLKRALYLLQYYGGDDINFDRDTVNDYDFLTEQMALRQQLAENINLAELERKVNVHLKLLYTKLHALFAQTTIDTKTIKNDIIKLHFFDKLKREIHHQKNHSGEL
ncbi:MAG: Fe-S protein assembly co-chaperone HscB [Pseudomonadota bacterium]